MTKVVCQICGKEFKWITGCHLKTHGITYVDYLKKYPNAETGIKIWNKGKTKKTDERVKKYSDKLCEEEAKKKREINKLLKEGKIELPFCACGCGGRVTKLGNKYITGHNSRVDNPFQDKHHTEESKQKNREANRVAQKGSKNGFYGKKHTDETKQKISKIVTDFYQTKEGIELKKLLSELRKDTTLSEEHKNAIGEGLNSFYNSEEGEELKKEFSVRFSGEGNPFFGKKHSKETIKILRDVLIKNRKKGIYNIVPNKKEQELYEFLQKVVPDEYKFVGDGKTIDVGGLMPDFININGQRKLIELYGDYWHDGDDEGHRIFYFRLFGYETLIIWEHELKDKDKLREKILTFHGLGSHKQNL